MTGAKFILFVMIWFLVIAKLNVILDNNTIALCFAIMCAGAIAKEEK